MNFSGLLKVALLFTCIFGFTTAAWADNTVKTAKSAQESVGEEAIVSGIDNEKITLRSTADVTRMCTIPMSNAAEELKLGDKVKVQGNIVKKIEAKADPATLPAPAPKSSTGTP